jgi:aconitate hydratase
VDFRLVQSLLESHGIEGTPLDGGDDALLLRPDQVLLGGEDASLAIALLEEAGIASVRVHPTIASPGRASSAAGETAEWQESVLRLGMLAPRPGHGELEVLHRETLAAPGRLLLSAGCASACGACGMLALPADAMAAAAVLAGGPLVRRAPEVLAVHLLGVPPPGVGGVDLALGLLAALRAARRTPEILEFGGEAVERLSMADRVAAAWLLAEAGLPVIFPADDRTRAELAGQGRDQDWRRLEAEGDGGAGAWRVDLAALEPLTAPLEEIAGARPLRELAGTGIDRVLLGPGATLADLRVVAAACAGRRLPAGMDLSVVAGSRTLLDRAAAEGLSEQLAAAGARVVAGEVSAIAAGAGTGLCLGVPRAAVAAGRGRWLVAGPGACAASALTGAVTPAVPAAAERVSDGDAMRVGGADPWLGSGSVASSEHASEGGVAEAVGTIPAPGPGGSFRGEVLGVLGDGVGCAQIITPGARAEGWLGHPEALASQTLSQLVPGFAERARARQGGFLVAGEDFGGGEPRVAAALCLAKLRVAAVLARSFAPGAEETLVRAGVLPLVLGEGPGDIEPGDEMELAGMPEALVPAHAVMARDLTRGTQHALRHGLGARDIAILHAGGLVALVAGRSAPAAGR